jgi:hypothetical protein
LHANRSLGSDFDMRENKPALSTQVSVMHQVLMMNARTQIGEPSFHDSSTIDLLTFVYADTLEMLLLLLWRHVEAYIEAETSVALAVPTSFTQSTKATISHDKSLFYAEIRRQLQPALEQLSLLETASVPFNQSHSLILISPE